jgi:DNA polymerase-3 subunit beta
MKLLCDREKLREGLAILNNVVPVRSPKPVLENVCLVATDDALELLGTDLEVSVRYRISDVKVEEPGPCVIPGRVALDFARDLSTETVSLSTSGSICRMSGGSDSCELVTVDPDEFPVVARMDEENSISLQGGTFSRLVAQTIFAVARDGGRYAMHGVLAEIENDILRLVATDGRRLAMSSAPVDAEGVIAPASIVPPKALQLFTRVIPDPLDQVRLQFADGRIGLKTRNAEIFTRLIEGEFPRYAAVIPKESEHSMVASVESFSRKLRLVGNIHREDARTVRLKFDKRKLEFQSQAPGSGSAKAEMDIEFSGSPSEIAFNSDFVLDGIKNCEGDLLRFEFKDKLSPGKFLLGENCFYIVMPITIDT